MGMNRLIDDALIGAIFAPSAGIAFKLLKIVFNLAR
jgi:hypothetical protein